MRYRAEVDGLRALAVLPVILFHAGFEAFDGGFIGVDMFFVISGYLITKLIYDEVDRGSFSLVGFYERRARRILPALFLVCFASVPFAWRWSLPDEFKAFSESVVAVSAFASNFYFWLHSDYFAAPAETTPLHHTWSLAVEEQFYVFYPLTLLALRGAGRRAVFAAILCGSVISLGLAEYASRAHPSANFYLMPGRAWELGVGALLSLADSRFRAWKTGSKQLLALGGLAAIAVSLAVFDPSTRHPGISTLLPVLGTAALIACATPDTVVGRLLGSRSLVGIGLVSYSAYLWHQPLFAFARVHAGAVTAPAYLILIAMTLGLAYLSWRFVEQPFRQKQRYRQSQVFAYAAAASAVLIAFGLAGRLPVGFPGRIENELRMVASWSSDRSPRYRECTSRPGSARGVDNACVYGPSSDPKVAIVGDSHAGAISHRLAQSLAESGRPLIEFSRAACPPAVGLSIHADKGRGCAEYNDQVRRRLLRDDIDTVVMIARWSQYIHLRPFDNLEGGRVTWTAHAAPIDAGDAPMSDQARIQRVGRLYAESVEGLVRQGKRVVLVYPVPEVGWNVPREVLRRMKVAMGKRDALTTSYEVFRQRHADTYAALDGVGDSPNLIRVRPEDVFCNTVVPGRCVAESEGKPYYWDDSHLNESAGAPLVVDQIRRAMKAKGWIDSW